ncbi:5-formyltetrahydrofolate cyclo-ligase [Candidatus Micrarchaeota archaeon]|nr:MAG: 5-formyltetrahydrofolate cyclo-ligase [Candidatus Micrarchaeota archaeon]
MKDEIIDKRKKHEREHIESKSASIMSKLFELPEFEKAGVVLFYASKRDEVQTLEMIQAALDKGKKIVLPITVVEGKNLILSEIKSVRELVEGAFGVLEPANFVPVEERLIELAVVPGVAFDSQGDRIGHGMGYYDKLLKKLKCPIIGLAFEFQLVDDIPEEEHDVRVHKIITEKRVIECE